MEVFPADDFSLIEIKAMMDELIENGLVVEYSANSELFWHVTGFNKHQKIDRPNPKHPAFVERSTNDRRSINDQSPPEGKGTVREGNCKGKESKGKESKVITPPVRMTLKNIRDSFREIIGVELGGGVNQSLSEIGTTYTPETINFALLATSTRTPKPTNPFMYFKSILEGKNNGHNESSGKSNNGKPSYDSCENRDYSAGEIFDGSDKW